MIAAAENKIDGAELDVAIEDVNRLMRFHGGAVDLVDVDASGRVEVRFAGMCQGCLIRPVTLYATIAPRLEQVAGVTEVAAQGVRVSEESRERMATIAHLT